MRINICKTLSVFTVFILMAFMSGCYMNRMSELDRDVQMLKENVSKIEKNRVDDKQQLEKKIKGLEEGFKSNSSRVDELIQRMPIVGGRVEEEEINEGAK